MEWWKNQWIIPGVIIIIVLLLLQGEFDVFNASIRGVANLVLYSYYSPLLLGGAALLVIWYYTQAKKTAPAEKH